jgi:hypothetical protein
MRQLLLVATVTVSVTGVAFETKGQSGQRGCTSYEDGGVLSGRFGDGDKAVSKARLKLRDFLWTRWVGHICARTILEGSTMEGMPWVYSFAVEPDEHGVWVIAVKFESDVLGGEDKIHHTSVQYQAYVVERREIPGSVLRKAYQLLLKDKNGVVRTKL